MRCKIFTATTAKKLEEAINQWLEENPVSPDSMRFGYGPVAHDDPVEYAAEHTLVLFYVPMMRIGR